MRSLITGGKGFVGSWLSRHLEQMGDEVQVIDAETDVADVDALRPVLRARPPDAVYHLAALSHVGASWATPEPVLRTNVLGTANLLAVARQEAPEAAVLVVSSAEVYGVVREDQLPLTESTPVAPVSPYAASKAAAEQVALQAWRGYGQRVLVVRPFNHVGPGQAPSFAVSALAKRIAEAKRSGSGRLTVGTTATRRDFSDVRDVVRAYRLVIQRAPAGSVLNVASGHDVAVADVAAMLMDAAGVQLELVTDPALVRPVDVPVLRGNPAALSSAVGGWSADIPLRTTLADVLAYWEARTT